MNTFSNNIFGQCATPIQTFPYNEGFETSDGQWFSGGTASDWAWGQPQKSFINQAASGIKCWIIGGLTNEFYNNSENSWLQSPCFDFTTLQHPEISFSVFWETEQRFDGATLQYSIDGGANWKLLGDDNYNPCISKNWHNTPSIDYLPGKVSGWSGTVQHSYSNCRGDSGSGGWLTAQHELSFLAGEKKVVFRFLFGSGSLCSNFEGFAIDDIQIQEAAPSPADFTHNCANNNEVSFADISPCANGHSWDFGDPASGTNNINNGAKILSHTFSAPGEYTVKLTSSFPNGTTTTISKKIVMTHVSIDITQKIQCNGDANGILTANVTGGNGNYQYAWNTNPPQNTPVISGLKAGTYNISITSPNACNTADSIILSQPSILSVNPHINDTKCNLKNGSIITTVGGGTSPYTYLWSNAATTPNLNNLPIGNYSVKITDYHQCQIEANDLMVKESLQNAIIAFGNDTTVCTSIILAPGNFVSYLWQNGSTASTFTVYKSGHYSVSVVDNEGCASSAGVNVVVDCNDIYFPTAFTPNNDGLNDFFGAIGNISSIQLYELKVFNRWGEMVFYSTNPQIKWSGKIKDLLAPVGTYTWISQYTLVGREPNSKHGSITLIR